MKRGTFYVTTPIYYPSDNLHIGHAYTTVAADALARYHRLIGRDVFFLTGTDEHGQKIQRRAQAAGKAPKEYVDEIVSNIKALWKKLHISYDDFIRTTDERHMKGVQAIFQKIYEKGDIYKSEYEGWYCTPCETFWLESRLEEGKCPNPDCRRPVEWLKEESYFFKLSKYQDRLLEYIEKNPDFIQPTTRRNEMINFIKSGLEDLCVSRTTFDWGIPVPFDSRHVIYVWFDALSNYVTAAGYLYDQEKFARFWPADVHLVGKEIVRFHTIIWPIILMAAELPLPRQVFGHGWLVLEGGKMSKSKGNVIDPVVLIDRYGVDAVRYFLLREIPFGSDGFYSEEALVNRINADLANDLGNLLSRTTAMIQRFHHGIIPPAGREEALDAELRELAAEAVREVKECMQRLELSDALAAVWKLVKKANKYIDETAPWSLARDPVQEERLGTVLNYMAEALRLVGVLLTPYLVETPERIWEQLGLSGDVRAVDWSSLPAWGAIPPGTRVRRGDPLFPRINIPAGEEDTHVGLEDFQRLDLRVARVLSAEKVTGTDRLMKLQVEVGDDTRQVVAGVGNCYRPEDLEGKMVILVANLKPARIRGLESRGMLLAAQEGDRIALLTVDRELPTGSKVS